MGAVDLLRAWRGKKGLNRESFITCVHRSFFASQDPDLWEHEVRDVVKAAFDELLRMVRGENFLQCIGILHLERWLAGSSGSETTFFGKDPPPPVFQRLAFDTDALPVKSKRQVNAQMTRRHLRNWRAAQKLNAERHIDWARRAEPGIAAARAKVVADRTEDEQGVDAVHASIASRQAMPRSARQRWEVASRRLENMRERGFAAVVQAGLPVRTSAERVWLPPAPPIRVAPSHSQHISLSLSRTSRNTPRPLKLQTITPHKRDIDATPATARARISMNMDVNQAAGSVAQAGNNAIAKQLEPVIDDDDASMRFQLAVLARMQARRLGKTASCARQ